MVYQSLLSALILLVHASTVIAWTPPAGGSPPQTFTGAPFTNGTSNGTSNGNFTYTPDPAIPHLVTAHAVLMSTAFLILFPVGAMIVRLGLPVMTVHLPMEVTALFLAVAGAGVGITLTGKTHNPIANTAHAVIGLVVIFSLLAFQPLMGWLQHRHFHQYHVRGPFGALHMWFGRTMVVLGMVNGGIGFLVGWQLEQWRRKSYIAVASFVGFFWIVCLIINIFRKKSAADLVGLVPKKPAVIEGQRTPLSQEEGSRNTSTSNVLEPAKTE